MSEDRVPKTARNSDSIASDLRARIIRGDLRPGQRLVERDLAEWYAISRTPVREAIHLLNIEGLVVLRPNRGAEVASMTAETARDLFAVIAELESLAAREFATRISSARLREIEARHTRMQGHFERRELEPYFAINTAIHEFIIEECGNPILVDMITSLMVRVRVGRHLALMDDGRWSEAMDEHEQMIVALRRHDPAAVAAVWRKHLLNSGRAFAEQIARASPSPSAVRVEALENSSG
ncbi:GntR family transcriptional regulator [Fulvimarina endophytica]|uniref:GntR family transcriptional regulator n=1 Tax=Fulvimarina endophytica TaxID=2293836 RepID=A0A371X9R0_9HYPH|nr:GntR family transcriptional regulator [Fulvimarina endophytica]RFC65978.1 GntR family transcriptional regulator [Fulvimarina endophytica]